MLIDASNQKKARARHRLRVYGSSRRHPCGRRLLLLLLFSLGLQPPPEKVVRVGARGV